jgi:fimbrial chaperone protein
MRKILRGMLAAAAVCASFSALAAEFTVTPVRIFMTPRDRAVAVTVTNDGNEEIVMQADLYTWRQKPDGTDELKLTEDLALSPPILKVPPRSRQVVRLARLTPPPAGEEVTYRLIVREVPEARPQKEGEVGLQLALAFSLPVFITPPGAKRQLSCGVQRAAADTVKAWCENNGHAYAQARGFELVSTSGEKLAARDTGGYILPGVKRPFDITRSAGTIPPGKMKLQVALDDGTTQAFEVTLAE